MFLLPSPHVSAYYASVEHARILDAFDNSGVLRR